MIYFGNSVCCESEISVLCRGGELKIEVNKITAKIKAIAKKAISKLAEYIDMCLSPKEKKIICERYGVFGSPERTQNEIAKDLGISRSYVSRIEKRALKTLFNRYEGH